ncbi:MAG TPA: DUF1461 domain-containing protein [Candidatus Nanoarchaeia archaeon]|nr:DUF1461 domain-containing protein [Candidatus Nanoarchaeia archaeon]
MRFLDTLKIILILILPVIVLIGSARVNAFNDSFYEKKFSEYGVFAEIENAWVLHRSVIEFINSKSGFLPDSFKEREKSHLEDVRGVVSSARNLLIFSVISFAIISAFAFFYINNNKKFKEFIGKVFFHGGILTIVLSLVFLIMMQLDFGATFERFHRLLFPQGTYLFDPSTEIIVNLYPEPLFLHIGIKIALTIICISASLILAGYFMKKVVNNKISP